MDAENSSFQTVKSIRFLDCRVSEVLARIETAAALDARSVRLQLALQLAAQLAAQLAVQLAVHWRIFLRS